MQDLEPVPSAVEANLESSRRPEPGKIVTFYSYKGGVGRSMALANVAWILASAGNRVLVIDWDLEAPGVHRYFSPFMRDPELRTWPGLIDHFMSYLGELMGSGVGTQSNVQPESPTNDTKSDGRNAESHEASTRDPEELEALVSEFSFVGHLQMPIDWDQFDKPGKIDLIGAGRQAPGYAECVNLFDWKRFFTEYGGRTLVERMFANMRRDYDWILIDSRTGVSDTSGICTIEIPDDLVLCYVLNNQNIQGAESVMRIASKARENRRLGLFPVECRLDPFEKDKLERRRKYARYLMAGYIKHIGQPDDDTYFDAVGIQYSPWYAYEEQLSPFRDRESDRTALLPSYLKLVEYLAGKAVKAPSISKDRAEQVVRQFQRFSYGAELHPEEIFERWFLDLSKEDQELAKWTLIGLVRIVGSDLNAETILAQISISDIPHQEVIHSLQQVGFLQVTPADGTGESLVTPSYPNITKDWPRLNQWVEENRFLIASHQQIRDFGIQYEKLDPKPDLEIYVKTLPKGALQVLVAHEDHLGKPARSFVQSLVESTQAPEVRWSRLDVEEREKALWVLTAMARITGSSSSVVLSGVSFDELPHPEVWEQLDRLKFLKLDPTNQEAAPQDFALALNWKPLGKWIERHREFVLARQQLQELFVRGNVDPSGQTSESHSRKATDLVTGYLSDSARGGRTNLARALSSSAVWVLQRNREHLGPRIQSALDEILLLRKRGVGYRRWTLSLGAVGVVVVAVSLVYSYSIMARAEDSPNGDKFANSSTGGALDSASNTTGSSTSTTAADPNPQVLELEAESSFSQGHYSAASSRYEELLKLRPNDFGITVKLAKTDLELKAYDRTKDLCARAEQLAGNDLGKLVIINDVLLSTYNRSGLKEPAKEAKRISDKALKSDPKSQPLLFQRAYCSQILGISDSSSLVSMALRYPPSKAVKVFLHGVSQSSLNRLKLPMYAKLSAEGFAIVNPKTREVLPTAMPGARYYERSDFESAGEVSAVANDVLRSLGYKVFATLGPARPPMKSDSVQKGTIGLWLPDLASSDH